MRKILTVFAWIVAFSAYSQTEYWAPISSGQRTAGFDKWSGVQNAQWSLNQESLQTKLQGLKSEFAFQMPMPDGSFETVNLKESSILEPGLQAKYPNIRTYKGTNLRGENIRMDMTSAGLHGIIFTRSGTVYIDPLSKGSSNYVSYYRADYKNHMVTPAFEESPVDTREAIPLRKVNRKGQVKRSSGSELKSYRIAIAADNEYSTFHGGSVEGVLAAIVTTMNRVTGIYENELAVTFVIVDNNDRIIYTNAATDPYNGLSTSEALTENQSNLDLVIGNANYDIGHVFTTGSGGLAGLGVVCRSSSKARGTTGIAQPIGDPFDVDFVAHEIGHQFAGNHTFNGSVGSCSGGNRNGSTAYEPGSGSTIMAYAGICGAHNIQDNSDPYFHAGSLDEILTFITDGAGSGCATVTETGNTPPQVSVPEGNFVIPVNTPFSLTATGSDADGDELTYIWEQYDLGDAGSPDNPSRTAPLFRSYSPTTSPTRYFPRLENVLAGTTVFGEQLPDVTRELNFRVTTRDNNPAGGGTNEDNIEINTSATAGPFAVTSQNSSTTYTGGSVQLVEWNVANTDKAPINLENVQILLSTDGGVTFTEVLSASTPNDGAEFIALPNISVSNARIMVSAVGNIFFNVNQTSFGIQENSEPGFSLLISEVPGVSCGNTIDFTVQAVTINGFSSDISLAFATDDDLSVSASSGTLTPGETVTLNVENLGNTGAKSINLQGTSDGLQDETEFSFSFLSAPDEKPSSVSPSNESTGVSLRQEFSWGVLSGASSYNFTLAFDEEYSNVVFESLDQIGTSVTLSEELLSNTSYFWKVSAVNECGEGPLAEQKFVTAFVQEVDLVASGLPINIFSQATAISIIDVTQDLVISDVNVENLDISHTYVADLTITLSSPAGTTVTLFEQECGSVANILLSYDDNASFSTLCPPNDGGTYQPVGALSAFNGESATGVWTLSVNDGFAGDEGTINGWNLVLQTETEAISLFSSSPVFDQVDLVWNDISNDIGYEIEQALGDGEFSKVSEVPANTTSASFTGLMSLTNYRYRVRAILSNGFSEYSNISPVITLPEPPLSPSNLTGTRTNDGRALLTWVDNSDVEEGFAVERSTDGTSFTEQVRLIENITSYIDNSAEVGVRYFYRIKAFNVSGESDPSDVLAFILLDLPDVEPGMIYPNPATESLTINAALTAKFQHLVITDLNGKKILRQALIQGQDASIDLGKIKPGLYVLQVISEDNSQQFKFVKLR